MVLSIPEGFGMKYNGSDDSFTLYAPDPYRKFMAEVEDEIYRRIKGRELEAFEDAVAKFGYVRVNQCRQCAHFGDAVDGETYCTFHNHKARPHDFCAWWEDGR